jgi:nitrite reductase/ring-hydroxylating ferredoxin subunit
MLTQSDNELLTQTGPGTPMGNLFRQYWLPALLSSELPAPDCPPIRIRILSENLIAFRVTSGSVGLIANSCPHRGASLFFGRNEEEGLRCVYHGWKFDVSGQCVDMPSEPAESNFRTKVRAHTYPCVERGGVVWAYMGPREVPPPLPDFEANMLGTPRANRTMRECNYMQSLEGDIDTCHASILHGGSMRPEDYTPGSLNYYAVATRVPQGYSVVDTDFGLTYGAWRPADDQVYWRIASFLFPCCTMNPTGVLGEDIHLNIWLPIDDEHVMVWGFGQNQRVPSVTQGNFFGRANVDGQGTRQGGPLPANPPDSSDWLGRGRQALTLANDFMIDREAQKNHVTYTGINGIGTQDRGVQESMGPIWDRTREHLGTSDSMVIRTRRKLLQAAKALRDQGIVPGNVDQPEVFQTRTGGVLLPKGADWYEATRDLRRGFVEHRAEGMVPVTAMPA